MTNLQESVNKLLDTLEAQNMLDPAVFGTQMKYLAEAATMLVRQHPELTVSEATTIMIGNVMERAKDYIQEEMSEE